MPFLPGNRANPGGRPPETIEIKEVRRLAQTRSHKAYEIIDALMIGAEKESVRLAAAISMLKMAGMNFDKEETRDVTPQSQTVNSFPRSVLMAAAEGNA